MTTEHDTELELVAVFKKGIDPEEAEAILENGGIEYRGGMDSSRGKVYFYSTGPKFILTFRSESGRQKFILQYRKLDAIHELYIPNWTIRKD